MVFPVAVGVGPCHTSSRPFPRGQNNNLKEVSSSNNDDTPQEVVQQHHTDDVIMAVGTNANETLSATIFISYHFIPISNPHNDNTSNNNDIDCSNGGNTQAELQNDLTNNGHTEHATNSIEMESLLHHDNNNHTSNNNQSSKSASDMHNSQQFNVIAELRVQITPTTAPYSSNVDAMSSRETKSRVPLGIMRRSDSTFTSYEANPCIEFASNETHLACLIPLPSGYQLVSPSNEDDNGLLTTSTIVIYRVQAQNVSHQQQLYHKKQHNLPKLPDYIVENEVDSNKTDKDATENNNIQVTTKSLDQLDISSHEDKELNQDNARSNSVLYVAHEPKIVRALQQQQTNTTLEESNESQAKPKGSFLRQFSTGKSTTDNSSTHLSTLQCATCMCTVPFDHYRGKSSMAKSFLLVGTTNESLLLIDFSMARVRSVLLKPTPDNLKPRADGYDNPIVHISQCTPTQWKGLDIYGEEQGSLSKGRIATITRDGSVKIYMTFFVPSSSVDNWVENRIEQSNSKSETKQNTGLEMRISLLSTYHTSKSNLRYIRARWINPILLVLLTRSPYLDEKALRQQSRSKQSDMVVAQVWTVAEVHTIDDQSEAAIEQVTGWRGSSDIRCNIALISELKMPCGDSLDELLHDTFSLSREASESTRSDGRMAIFTKCTRGMTITYHSGTDCLAVNSLAVTRERCGIKVRPFCLIWDWKHNVPGLTLASSNSYCLCPQPQQQIDNSYQIMAVPPLYYWFQLGQDEKHGLVAVHVHTITSGTMYRARKNIYSLSTLLPLSRSITEGHSLNVTEPSAILLHHDSVTFPILSRVSINGLSSFTAHYLYLFSCYLLASLFFYSRQIHKI